MNEQNARPADRPDAKSEQLDPVRVDPHGSHLTTQQGVRLDHTDDALTAGERGPTLLEDFHAREKVTHFDHDAVLVPCGPGSVSTLASDGYPVHFVLEAFKHQKPVGAFGEGVQLLEDAGVRGVRLAGKDDTLVTNRGVVTTLAAGDSVPDDFAARFLDALAGHRAWDRDTKAIPA